MSDAPVGRWLLIAAGLVVVATVVGAVVVMGGPWSQRDIRMDERRVRDLDAIVDAIDCCSSKTGVLPPDLATLADKPGRRLSFVDPVDGTPYEYQVTGERSYRLCATFVTDTAVTDDSMGRHGDEWLHGVGRHCFDRTRKDSSKQD